MGKSTVIRNATSNKASHKNQLLLSQAFSQAIQLYEQKEYGTALKLCQQSLIPMAPENCTILNLAGVCAYQCKCYELSVDYLHQAIRIEANAGTWFNLALSFVELKRADDAKAAYRTSLSLDNTQFKAWNNLGNLIIRDAASEQTQEAIACYERALAVNPNYAQAHINLGFAYEKQGNLIVAEKHYRLGVSADPNHVMGLLNLANLLDTTKHPHESIALYKRVLAIQPTATLAAGRILDIRRKLADWNIQFLPTVLETLDMLVLDKYSKFPPLSLLALPEATPQLQRQVSQYYAHAVFDYELNKEPLIKTTYVKMPHQQRIRIGYLSADFRNHPVAHLVSDVILEHDKTAFEVFLYAYGPPPKETDQFRYILQTSVEHFIDIHSFSDTVAAQHIIADKIDILVDLTGYTTHARLGITALRPAPVIVSWLGYIGSLGEPRLADYIIGDAVATPPEYADFYSETLALMPHCYQPNSKLKPLAAPPTRAQENLPENAIVFCSFNQSFKFNPELWDDWCNILKAVPNSVLWLASPAYTETIHYLQVETEARGISATRIIFAKRTPLNQHQARIQLADLALDTFPYNSGTTASDVLRAGVPMITRMGSTFVSRMGASLLTTIGLPELITTERHTYINLAIDLANNAQQRVEIKEKLIHSLNESALFNPQLFTLNLEKLYCAMLMQVQSGTKQPIIL